jgi:small-conductance mechanosensitive channel
MEGIPTLDELVRWRDESEAWLYANVFVWSNLVQVGVIALAFVLALVLDGPLQRRLDRLSRTRLGGLRLRGALSTAARLALPLVWLILQWLAVLAAQSANWPHRMMTTAVSLLTAWIVIRLASQVVRDPGWSRFLAISAWTLAALNVVGLLDPTIRFLDGLSIRLGELRVSAYSVLKGVAVLTLLLWLASVLSRVLESRIVALPNLTPSAQVLFTKLLKIVLVTLAVVGGLASVGIDLTAFAVFSGAVGVGVGFGLQKVVSNLVSGVILLLDKSVKPGDVIAVAGYFGKISSLGARYVSVITRDGVEYLIPNEELITQRVENWSYSNNLLRLRVPVGVAYGTDVRLAMRLCLEAAAATRRILAEPKAACLLRGFGESSVELEIRFWINDPMSGRANVTSDLLLGVWDRFREHGIEIPFPQRDVHIRSTPTLVERPGQAPG